MFSTISVEIKGKKDLVSSLKLYGEGDVLDGDNKFYCDRCQQKVFFYFFDRMMYVVIYLY
jgi:ubiquitin C-terminal hydrolase